jgi:diamine N-acetyltransferase
MLMVHQIFANIGADNSGSIRLFERKGFKPSGRKHDWLRKGNIWQDELFYQLINPNS